MKTSIFMLLVFVCMQSCCAQQNKTLNQSSKKDTIMEQQYGMPEKYDFESAREHGVGTHGFIKNEWLIAIGPMDKEGGWSAEYAPARGFYVIGKYFYPNGMIKHRVKGLGSVYFGLREEFDNQGNLIKVVDEDKKFGKIKPKDIIEFLEKEGWFNRETGENKILGTSPIKTDGSFYRDLMKWIPVDFIPVARTCEKEVQDPQWHIVVTSWSSFPHKRVYYVVDGNTGEFTKKEEEFMIEY